jgi:hypothetical protein
VDRDRWGYLDEAAALFRQGAFHVSLGLVHAHRARLRDERGELGLALDALDEGLDYFRRAGPKLDLAGIFVRVGRSRATADPKRARPSPGS